MLTVIHDSTGMNQDCQLNSSAFSSSNKLIVVVDDIDDEFKTPRGIRGYKLVSATNKDFTQWRVAGSEYFKTCNSYHDKILNMLFVDIGGENAPDKVRGPYNEGGWWFERVGKNQPK